MSTGVWLLSPDRLLSSYAPLRDEELVELKPPPDKIAFQKAKVNVPIMKVNEGEERYCSVRRGKRQK